MVRTSSSIEGERSVDPPPFSFTKVFCDALPFYLSIGMSYDDFWNGDVEMAKYYREAYELKRDRTNEQLWLQGMYIYEALCDVAPYIRAFSKSKPVDYSSEPYAITEEEIERRKERKAKEEFDKCMGMMQRLASSVNQKILGEESE